VTPIARPRLRRRWPVVLAIGLLLAGLVLTVAATKTLP
jgi:hypothetical protein